MYMCDAHVHNCLSISLKKFINNETYSNYAQFSSKFLLHEIKKNHIVKMNIFPIVPVVPVAFPNLSNNTLIPKLNTELINLTLSMPHIFNAFLLLSENIRENDLSRDYIKGVKIHFYLHNIISDLDKYSGVLQLLNKMGKFVILHSGKRIEGLKEDLLKTKLDSIKTIVTNFPRIKLIIAHSGRTFPFRPDGINEFLEKLISSKIDMKNLFFDTSTIRSTEGIEDLITKVNINKIIFGSDFPYFKNKGENIFKEESSCILDSSIDDNIKKLILYENYKTILYPNQWWIRRCLKNDIDIMKILNALSNDEKKFLALSRKWDLIRNWIREENYNLWIIEHFKYGLCGYLRFSDRENNGLLLEEIAVFPDFRRKGYAKECLKMLKNKASYILVKTFNNNETMKNLLYYSDFKIIKTSKSGGIILWKWENSLED